MTYDHWKTTNPADKFLGASCQCGIYCQDLGPQEGCRYFDVPPEVYQECSFCNGEGGIEKWESVSKWSIDPPSAIIAPCDVCNGAGGFICEAEGDQHE